MFSGIDNDHVTAYDIRVGKVSFFVSNISIPIFVCISYKNLILSEKETNPLLILNTQYTYRGCADLPSKK